MDPLIESHRDALRTLAERQGLVDIRVFGSMARGDAHEGSDVDLLVSLRPGVSGLAIGALIADAADLLGRKVEVVTEQALHPALRARVISSAVAL